VSTPDHLRAALEKIAELEAELAEWRATDRDAEAVQRAEAEVADLKREIEALRREHAAELEAQKARTLAEIEVGAASTRAQIERARLQGELQSIQLRAAAVEQDQETYLERLNALASELSEEIEVLLSFSREQAVAYYTKRLERESEVLERSEKANEDAQRLLGKKEAEARATGQRTIAKMQELDKAIEVARLDANAASVAARDARTRLEAIERKLARCSQK
jgi:hypothetical protein